MSTSMRPEPRARAVIGAMIPAYLFPLLTSLPGAWITGDRALRAAATTTIPGPGALAAGLVAFVLATHGWRWAAAFRGHLARFVALVGLLTGALGAGVLLLLLALGALDAGALRFAMPGPFVAGAITAYAWGRRRLAAPVAAPVAATWRGPAVMLLAIIGLHDLTGCAAPLPHVVVRAPAGLDNLGESPAMQKLGDVARTCIAWGVEAETRADSARRAQGRWSAVSAIAGSLGTAVGIATTVNAAREGARDDDKAAARTGQIGGSVALGLGLVAGVSGMLGGARSNAAAEHLTIAVGLEQAVRDHLERTLAAAAPERERVAASEATALLATCVELARRGEIALLPSPAALGTGEGAR